MAKQYQPVEVNSFVKGLITEASPLTFPEGASLDEKNFVLNKDGTRNRRQGMREEVDGEGQPMGSSFSDKQSLANVFIWKSPGGLFDRTFLVIQDGDSIKVFDREVDNISKALLYTYSPLSFSVGSSYSFASVDGVLVFVTGGKLVHKVEFDGSSFTPSSYKLKIRDEFGVHDGLYEGMDVTVRPDEATDEHIYNLRNQSWGVPRRVWVFEGLHDTISNFQYRHPEALLPSNADMVNQSFFPDTNDPDDRVGKRFFAAGVINSPVGTVEAAKGYFIIDALDRGKSRREEVRKLHATHPELGWDITSLPTDSTPGGATVVSEYGGRLWYSGFSSSVEGGDTRSPKLSSYVLFSQLVRDPSNFPACHQKTDPTSFEDSTLVDTDGGFLRVEEAVNIKKLVNLGRRMVVLADNGVWSVEGGNDYGFTATNYLIRKITDKGLLGSTSVVTVDQTLFYWSDGGIMYIAPNQVGDLELQNLTNTTIQKRYSSIDYSDRSTSAGVYDSYERKVRWVYGGNQELIFDLNLQAFYFNEFNDSKDVRSVFNVPSYRTSSRSENIYVDGEEVTVNGENVFVNVTARQDSLKETKYAVVSPTVGGGSELTFATLSDPQFKDWGEYDSEAYLITGYLVGGDSQRYKSVPYLTLHFKRTESGLDSDYNLQNQSSCYVRAAWEWTNSVNSNRWGRQFQGYRFKRHYLPANLDEFDTGYDTVVTKNKLRGKGRALSLHFRTEPGKDCHLLGWAMILGVNNNV